MKVKKVLIVEALVEIALSYNGSVEDYCLRVLCFCICGSSMFKAFYQI